MRLLILFLALFVATGCKAIGVADFEVRSAVYDTVDALDEVHRHADDHTLVQRYTALAINRFMVLSDMDLSDLDQEKFERIKDALLAIYKRRGDADYVRVRSLSISVLTASLGLYDGEGLKEVESVLNDLKTEEDK